MYRHGYIGEILRSSEAI